MQDSDRQVCQILILCDDVFYLRNHNKNMSLAKVEEFCFANMRSGRKQRVWEQQMMLLFYFIVIGEIFLIYLLAMH